MLTKEQKDAAENAVLEGRAELPLCQEVVQGRAELPFCQLADQQVRPTDTALNGVSALPESQILEAAAAQSAEIAATFIRQGNRRAGREHLLRAIEQLNEAELED